MNTTGVGALDRTIQETNIWLNSLMEELGWESKQDAYSGLRAVLQTLRDRLLPDEATHLAAQLPMLIRGFFFEGWDPSKTPIKEKSKKEFLNRVRAHFSPDTNWDFEMLVRAVFKILGQHVSQGEIHHVVGDLPKEIQALWPAFQPV